MARRIPCFGAVLLLAATVCALEEGCEAKACSEQEDAMLLQVHSQGASSMALNHTAFGDETPTNSWCIDLNFPQGAVDVQVGFKLGVELKGKTGTLKGSLYLGLSFGTSNFKLAIGVAGYASITVTLPEGIEWSSPSTALEWTIQYLVEEIMEDCVLARFIGTHNDNTGADFAGFLSKAFDQSDIENVGATDRTVAAHDLITCWFMFLDKYDVNNGEHPFVKAGEAAFKALEDDGKTKAYNVYTDYWVRLFVEFFMGCEAAHTNCENRDLSFDQQEHWDTWDYDCNKHVATNWQDQIAEKIQYKWQTNPEARKQVMSRLCWVMKSGVLLGEAGFNLKDFAWGRKDSREADNFRRTVSDVFMKPFFPVQPTEFKDDMDNVDGIIQMITNKNDPGNQFKQKLAQTVKDFYPMPDAPEADGSAGGAKRLSNLMLWLSVIAAEKEQMVQKLSSYYDKMKEKKDKQSPKAQCKDCNCGITEAKLGGSVSGSGGDGSFCQGMPYQVDLGAEVVYTQQKGNGVCDLKAEKTTTSYLSLSVELGFDDIVVAVGVTHYLGGGDDGKTEFSVSIAKEEEEEIQVKDLQSLVAPTKPDAIAKPDDKKVMIDKIQGEATNTFLKAINDFFKNEERLPKDFAELVKAMGEFFATCAKAFLDDKIDGMLDKFYETYVKPSDPIGAITDRLQKTFDGSLKMVKKESIGLDLQFEVPKLNDIKGSTIIISAVEGSAVQASQEKVGSMSVESGAAMEIFNYRVNE